MSRHLTFPQDHSRATVSGARLLERIMTAGVPDRGVADRALRMTLSVLGQHLTDDEALALSTNLPDDLARIVEQSEYYAEYPEPGGAREFYERVRRREKLPPGVVREHVNVVLRALGEELDDELRRRLARALPGRIGEQLSLAPLGEPPPHAVPTNAPPLSTLSHGRPGSRHPLSEAAPSLGHAHSVARSDDPHGETKLSSSRGLTQERLGESLGSGRPPKPSRSIAEAKDD